MNLSQLQTLFQKLKSRSRGEFRTISDKAGHDWKSMVLIFAILSLITIGGGLYVFVQIAKGRLFQGNGAKVTEIKKINQKDLDRVIQLFDTKKQILDGLSDRVGVMEDPSL